MTLVSETSHKQNHCRNHKAALNEKPTDSPQWFFIRRSIQHFSFEDKGNFAIYDKDQIIETFEFHASKPGMWSAEDQATIPLKFLIIMHNYTNVWTINQSKSLPGFRVLMTSLDGIYGRSVQT